MSTVVVLFLCEESEVRAGAIILLVETRIRCYASGKLFAACMLSLLPALKLRIKTLSGEIKCS